MEAFSGIDSQEELSLQENLQDFINQSPLPELRDILLCPPGLPLESGMQLTQAVQNMDLPIDGGTHLLDPMWHDPEDVKPLPDSSDESNISTVPCLDSWEGVYKFNVSLSAETASRKLWVYSVLRNKIYTDVQQVLPIDFRTEGGIHLNAYIRAEMIYTDQQNISRPVHRCPNHIEEDKKSGKANIKHVLQTDHERAYYHEDPKTERLSLVIPYGNPQPGTDYVRHHFKFVCKSSCPGGMNRRATSVSFQLLVGGEVVGRQSVPVRICSCPARDKKKDEETLNKDSEFFSNELSGKRRCSSGPQHTHKNKKSKSGNEEEKSEMYSLLFFSKEQFEVMRPVARALVKDMLPEGRAGSELLKQFDAHVDMQLRRNT